MHGETKETKTKSFNQILSQEGLRKTLTDKYITLQ